VTKYKLLPAQFRKNLLQADWMVAEMRARAEKVKAAAEAIAPIETGAYKRRFRIRTRKRGGIHNDRAEALVVNTDPAAMSIEFGHTSNGEYVNGVRVHGASHFVDGHYTLTTALDAAGE
jgi:NOL1/NOP2/fmu family ribosome biogenesis protein